MNESNITVQQLAAYAALLVAGPGTSIWKWNTEQEIRAAFDDCRRLSLEVGGIDFNKNLIDFQIDVQLALKNDKPVTKDALSRHGFYGNYAFWFWSKIHDIGETTFFNQPPGFYKIDFIRGIGRDDVIQGWLTTFTEAVVHNLYHTDMRSRAEVSKILKKPISTGPVFPYLLHFVKTKPVEFLE